MSHTVTHKHLPLLSNDDQKSELSLSKLNIEKKLHNQVFAVAYPFGHRNGDTVKISQMAGYSLGFTFDNGLATNRQNRFLLKRFMVTDEDTGQSIIDRIKR